MVKILLKIFVPLTFILAIAAFLLEDYKNGIYTKYLNGIVCFLMCLVILLILL